MSDRKEQVLDAAIAVLGTKGLRALTHRAVDAQAGLPEGSTSNGFRTRETLIGGILDRLVDLETALWQRLAGQRPPHSLEEFAQLIAAMVGEVTGSARALTLARHAIFHEAAFQPELQRKIRIARQRLAGWGEPWLAQFGSTAPQADFLTMLALLDGLVAIQLACPEPGFDPTPSILTALRGMRSA
ncbi:hypothetical protein Cme02nite_53580 [Catellatospora methionotrophica]|uniref:HTH tetR-type domain-containing protein n=1 Tax=Catellatospora methionotrophica TaxID=121620 RepID=A0A8J3PGQ4_9ACTN|nr:TetR/AcrR family transcriptional regulator [Catellatospora methionotrophica]GIG17026.1 hypothetical protein Cme02nite_53580 [Catellatospora methionotrophica]